MNTAEKLERQQREREAMRQAIAAYTGPITKCPPGRSTNALPRRRRKETPRVRFGDPPPPPRRPERVAQHEIFLLGEGLLARRR